MLPLLPLAAGMQLHSFTAGFSGTGGFGRYRWSVDL